MVVGYSTGKRLIIPGRESHDDRRNVIRGCLLQCVLNKRMACFLRVMYVTDNFHRSFVRDDVPYL